MKRKLWAMIMCICMLITIFPVQALATDETPSYVALGDSITTGYGLADVDTEAFPVLVAGETGTTLTNLAVDGETSASLLEKMNDADVSAAVQSADVITLTIGGNDLMNALYAYLAAASGMTVDQVQAMLNSQDLNLIELAPLADMLAAFPQSEEAVQALTSFTANVTSILAEIEVLNPDAVVVMTNQYNPYGHFDGTALDALAAAFETGVQVLNTQIRSLAANANVTVADVYAAFASGNTAATPLCNATLVPALNLDFHPNADGHSVIASVVVVTIGTEPPVSSEVPFTDISMDDWFYDPVAWVYEQGLMTGTSATEFSPNTTTTRAMIVAILHRLEESPSVESAGFSDVADSDWYVDAVNWAASEGIVGGFGDNTFQPNSPITREQMASILYRYAEYKGLDVSARVDLSIYSDQPSAWAEDVMQWAVAEGLFNGVTDDQLQPQGNATRAQVAAILQRFLSE